MSMCISVHVRYKKVTASEADGNLLEHVYISHCLHCIYFVHNP